MTVRVNLVTDDSTLAHRTERYVQRLEGVRVTSSSVPAHEKDVDVYVVPLHCAEELLDGETRPATWLPIIAYGPRDGLRGAFLIGCTDYLREPWATEELVFRANRAVRPSSYSFGSRTLELETGTLRSDAGKATLSYEECVILRTLLARRGAAVPRDVLSYALWGRPRVGSRAIDVHISSLRKKIRSITLREDGANPIRSVRGVGYLLGDPS